MDSDLRPAQRAEELVETAPPPAQSVATVPSTPWRFEPVFNWAEFARLQAVTSAPSLSARAEFGPFVGRREIFEFLLDHPDFATHVTRALRVARYQIRRTADGLFIDDGAGAFGRLSLVYATSGTRVMYARGEYQHRRWPSIAGQAVVTLEYSFRPAGDGRDLVSTVITGHVKLDSAFADATARMASTVLATKADKEAQRLLKVFARVSRAIEENAAAVYAALQQQPDVPQPSLEIFRALLNLP